MSKAKIYKGIACLEAVTPGCERWWYQPGRLAYSPIEILEIKKIVAGRVGLRKVLAVPVEWGGQQTMVALNLPRTDLWAMAQRGLLPPGWPVPRTPPVYTKPPEATFATQK